MLRALIFDCFGVLYHGSVGHLTEMMPKEHLQEFEDIRKAVDLGILSKDAYDERLAEMLSISRAEIDEIMKNDHRRNEELFAYVKSLKSNYRIGLLTNVSAGVIETLFTEQELTILFDAVVKSSDAGVVKPDPRIYEMMLKRIDVEPSDAIMIDDLQQNIDGAKSVGMDGVVYSTLSQLKSDFAERGITDA